MQLVDILALVLMFFMKIMIVMILKFTSQSVEFDRARDTDLAQHASHPKNNPPVQQKEGTEGKRGVGKNSARMDTMKI